MNSKFHTLNIRTPEGVTFALMLASPVVRMLAWLIDVSAIAVATLLIRWVLAIAAVISSEFAMALSILVYFAVTIGYGILMEWLWNGQTLGKRILRLRVVDEGGHRLHFNQIVVRNLLRFVDSLPFFYFVGGVATLLNGRAQRLGDLAAGTVVVRQPKIQAPDVDQIGGVKYSSFRDHPLLEARLRARLTPREASLALAALLRRNEFDDAARLKIFRALADRFKPLADFPSEVTDDLSDEHYTRDVVCAVYRLNENGAKKNARKDPDAKDRL